MGVQADLMAQRAAMLQAVAIVQVTVGVQADLTADEEHVALPGRLDQLDLTVLRDLTAQQRLMVLVDLTARLTLRVVPPLEVHQVAVHHVEQLVLHEGLMVQQGLTAQVHQVDRTVGNSHRGVANDAVEWRLKIRKRHVITRNSG